MAELKQEQTFQGDVRQQALKAIEEARESRTNDSGKMLETTDSNNLNSQKEEKSTNLEVKSENSSVSESELQARAIGWKSREEREAEGRDNKNFIEADEYLRRQPLFQRINDYGKEIKSLREMLAGVPETLAEIKKEAYNKALVDLQAQAMKAFDDSDKAKFNEINKEIQRTQVQMVNDPALKVQSTKQTHTSVDYQPEVKEFMSRNQNWYNDNTAQNRLMKEAAFQAQQLERALADSKGETLSTRDLMDRVETRMKTNFPEVFPSSRKETPNLVGKSTGQSEGNSTRNDPVSKLNAAQREVAELLARKLGGNKEKQDAAIRQYAEELDKLSKSR